MAELGDESVFAAANVCIVGNLNRDVKTAPLEPADRLLQDGESSTAWIVETIGGGVTIGTVMAFLQFNEMFWRPIRDLSEKYNIMQTAMASSERVFKLLDDDTLIPDDPAAVPLGSVRGDIEFRNVWFAYNVPAGGGEPEWVLRNVSFTIRAGETAGRYSSCTASAGG